MHQLLCRVSLHANFFIHLQGLGNTLQTIGLIVSNPPAGCTYPIKQHIAPDPATTPRTTLILCPLSVIGTWKMQINQFAAEKKLKFEKYWGPNRKQVLQSVACGQVDILAASYHTLASCHKTWQLENTHSLDDFGNHSFEEHRSKKRRKKDDISIFDLKFHRVVLDEAHSIRNCQTGFFQAAKSLQSTYKLCLTGTPFVNKPNDIQSLLSFLGVDPLKTPTVFSRCVTSRIAAGDPLGLATLRSTMVHVCLRRKKDQASDVHLTNKEVSIVKVPWPEGAHKTFHDILYTSARATFVGALRGGLFDGASSIMKFLTLILRVRQACCDMALVPEVSRSFTKL
jgi:SWI/SNF-related matrix-associated actin-dependent regulator of chromatin subfamily A3